MEVMAMSSKGRPAIPREDLLNELQRLADELGRTPTKREMNDMGAYSGRAYLNRFGSWNAAVEEIGLEPNSQGGANSPTDEVLLKELQRLADALGRTPTGREMNDRGEFSTGVYRSRFGTWNAALVKAGLTPNRSGSKPKHNQIIQQLREAEQ